MNSFIHTLSDTVLSKRFESCDLQELETLSQQHPYSSAIQLLYAQKLKQSGHAGYNEQLQKTLLYYSNPLFIKHLIESNEHAIAVKASDTTPVERENIMIPEEQPLIEDLDNTGNDTLPVDGAVDTQTESTIPETREEIVVTDEKEAVDQTQLVEDEPVIEDEADMDPAPDDLEDEATLPPLPEFKFEPIDPAKAELAFTPYHTIDYFAAQGIKLGDEQQAGDRFGTQLKSFTAWLKQMKRLPGASAKGNISVTEEKSIEQMAEQSLKGENADTEAMAQVWAKQGNSKKAIEIYKKLSLQIPAKSAYFAAKIDHLKK